MGGDSFFLVFKKDLFVQEVSSPRIECAFFFSSVLGIGLSHGLIECSR